MLLKDNDIVLFQGDSITDCGRHRDDYFGLGGGYPAIVSSLFAAIHPDKQVTFLNRGISGNTANDLAGRWDRDCIDLKPTVVSILVGINDSAMKIPLESFENDYRNILTRTKENTNAKIILLEPFFIPNPEDRDFYRDTLDPNIRAVRLLAREFGAIFIPLDGIFAQYTVYKPSKFWSPDGVHLTTDGHTVVAKMWMQAVGAL